MIDDSQNIGINSPKSTDTCDINVLPFDSKDCPNIIRNNSEDKNIQNSPILKPKSLSKLKFDAIRSIFEMNEANHVSHNSAGKTEKSQVFDFNTKVSPKISNNLGENKATISVNSTRKSASLRTSKSSLENKPISLPDIEALRFADKKPNRVIRKVSRVATESDVVRLPNPKSESKLKKDKNKGKPSSDRKQGKRKNEDGSFGSIAPITDYFERKTLMKHASIEGESNP